MFEIDTRDIWCCDAETFKVYSEGYKNCSKHELLNLLYRSEKDHQELLCVTKELVTYLLMYRAALKIDLEEPEDEPEEVHSTRFTWKLTPAEEAYFFHRIPRMF
jgi:hypothetical protein